MADTLVDDFDVIEFLHVLFERCVQLLGVSAAGLLLSDQRGTLQVVAASGKVPASGAVPAADRPRALCGLFPHRPTSVGA
jgi:hypothetical protein